MSLKETIRELAARTVPPNEESAKAYAVYPILQLLGWPTYDPSQVAFDQPLGSRSVAIALKARGRDVAYLVTKAPGTPLSGHADRALRHAVRGVASVLVFTTGVEWWLHLATEDGPADERRFAALDIRRDSPEAVAEGLRRYVGSEALASGSAEARARAALAEARSERRIRAELPMLWEEMVTEPGPELVSLVQERLRARTGLEARASLVAEMLSDMASSRYTGYTGPVVTPETERMEHPTHEDGDSGIGDGPNATQEEAGADGDISQTTGPSKPITRIRGPKPASWSLLGTEARVKTWAEMLVGVFEAVHNLHESEFLEASRPVWGASKPWISKDQEAHRKPRAIGNGGLYAEVNLSAKDIRNRCRRLLTHFGHDADELKITLREPAGTGDSPPPKPEPRRTRRRRRWR